MKTYVSRAGEKLQFALDNFKINIKDMVVADFGSSTGGFVDCLLQNGAKKVYSIDTSYGELAWKLRNDPKVVVMERTNAMHVKLPEKMDLITIDTSWTKQILTVPNALNNLKENGMIISLIKPHYEAPREYLEKGKLKDEYVDVVLDQVKNNITAVGGKAPNLIESPIVGEKGKNREFLALIK
ncbi:MAG TPA: SAM-dependent methyltransferase [Patescibacteria group bacterium]|nr:SAM-dependent methyltransferase [Patescibacteria group bacterium]